MTTVIIQVLSTSSDQQQYTSYILIFLCVLISKSQHWHKRSDDEVQLLHRKQTKPALKNPEYMKPSPLNLQWSWLETQTGNHTALCTQQTHTNTQTHTQQSGQFSTVASCFQRWSDMQKRKGLCRRRNWRNWFIQSFWGSYGHLVSCQKIISMKSVSFQQRWWWCVCVPAVGLTEKSVRRPLAKRGSWCWEIK